MRHQSHSFQTIRDWLDRVSSPHDPSRPPLREVSNPTALDRLSSTDRKGKWVAIEEPIRSISPMAYRTPSPPKKLALLGLDGRPQPDHTFPIRADPDQTPRALSQVSLPSLSDENRSRSDVASQDSARSERSRSPIKRDDFRSCVPRIEFVENVETTKGSLPQEDLRLFRRIRQAGQSIPPGLKGHLEEHYAYPEDIRWSSEEIVPEKLDQLWRFVRKIEANAAKCSKYTHTEDSWGDQVVLKVLEFSKEWADLDSQIDVANLKTIQVSPTDLLPTAPSGRLMSKKIDYTLCIEPDEDELQKIEQALKQMVRGTDSVSQSVQPMLKYRPLFGATEIKKASGPDALPQLAVWSCAGLTKLSRLVQDSRNKLPLPSLPCWSVVGHQWQLYMAKRCSDTLVQIQGPAEHVYRTDSLLGIVQLVLALRELHTWGATEYRDWFMKIIDGLQ